MLFTTARPRTQQDEPVDLAMFRGKMKTKVNCSLVQILAVFNPPENKNFTRTMLLS